MATQNDRFLLTACGLSVDHEELIFDLGVTSEEDKPQQAGGVVMA